MSSIFANEHSDVSGVGERERKRTEENLVIDDVLSLTMRLRSEQDDGEESSNHCGASITLSSHPRRPTRGLETRESLSLHGFIGTDRSLSSKLGAAEPMPNPVPRGPLTRLPRRRISTSSSNGAEMRLYCSPPPSPSPSPISSNPFSA